MYAAVDASEPLLQGDMIHACPLVVWHREDDGDWTLRETAVRVIVLTQSCDLENRKISRVQVAVVHDAASLVDRGIIKAQTIRDQVRRHRVFGWYFLPSGEDIPESIVDLRDIHSIPRELLEERATAGDRIGRLVTPYREHLAQHFAVTFSRIALPEPYETE